MRWIRRALLVVATVSIAWLGIVWSGVLPLISPEQRAALAFLRDTPPPPPGRNAFALLWAQPWAVPAGQEEALLAEDLSRFSDYEARWTAHAIASRSDDRAEAPEGFASAAHGRFPQRPVLRGRVDAVCRGEWNEDCLATVARDPAAARAALAEVADTIALMDRLVEAEHLRNPFPPSLVSPLPGYGEWARLAISVAALRAHDADAAGALDRLCRFGLAWRRLRTGTNTLVGAMVGISYATIAMQQALAIHAAAPAGTGWPAPCDTLLMPLSAAERDQCEAARGEFALVERASASLGPWPVHPALAPLDHTEHTLSRLAGQYRPLCPRLAVPDEVACSAFEWVFNPVGCRVLQWVRPMPGAVAEHAVRLDDFDRRLTLARAARWWRAQPGAETGEAPVWPEAFAAIRDEIIVDPATRTLVLPMRHARVDRNPARFGVRY